MRKSVSAESIYQFTKESVVWDRIRSPAKVGNRWILSKLPSQELPILLPLSQEIGFSSIEPRLLLTAQCSVLQDVCKFILKGDPCSKKGWGKVRSSKAFMCMQRHHRTGNVSVLSEEATFGVRNDFKRSRKTPPQVWFKDQETCDLI